jgi:spermidine synthase
LIGGLGFGYTLRAALAALGSEAQVVVAELMPAIVRWNRELLKFSAPSLSDTRVRILEKDVSQVLAASSAEYDVILLDIDNGPAGLSLASNHKLYGTQGLTLIKKALRSGGWLGVWSAQEDAAFYKRLKQAGFEAEAQQTPAHVSGKQMHTLFLGRKSLA